MPPVLNSLPPEILQIIIHYLHHECVSSIPAFALVSKSCYTATTPLLFRTIKISISFHQEDTVRDVQSHVQRQTERLQHASSYAHVRRLIIDSNYEQPEISAAEQGRGSHQTLDGYLDNFRYSDLTADKQPWEAVHGMDHAWTPLADLIKQLPLIDLLYGFPSQFPPCLLQALHQYQPQCRLHLNTFQLRSLNALVTDPYEFKLVTSPSLHSIRIVYDEGGGYDSSDIPNYHGEAVTHIVKSLAPNLKEFHLYHIPPAAHLHGSGSDRQPWKGFAQDGSLQEEKRSKTSIGSLKYLRLHEYTPFTKKSIEDWRDYTDFGVLQALNIETDIKEDALDSLANTALPCLKTLALNMAPEYGQNQQRPYYYTAAKHFLQSLPPLSTLSLKQWRPDLPVDSFISHHGHLLRKFSLTLSPNQHLTERDVLHISQNCPTLEDMTLCLPRSRGDAKEVALYQALGSLPRLKSLDLTLDASGMAVQVYHNGDSTCRDDDGDGPEAPSDPSFDEFDQLTYGGTQRAHRFPRNGHIRDTLINGALDPKLTCAIFQTISSGKPNISSLPLEKLTVRVDGAANFRTLKSNGKFDDVLQDLGRSWKVERHLRGDCRHGLLVREVEVDQSQKQLCSRGRMRPWLEKIFRRIWPGNGNWWDDWHSLPLATSG